MKYDIRNLIGENCMTPDDGQKVYSGYRLSTIQSRMVSAHAVCEMRQSLTHSMSTGTAIVSKNCTEEPIASPPSQII